jgi:hypothetical protein
MIEFLIYLVSSVLPWVGYLVFLFFMGFITQATIKHIITHYYSVKAAYMDERTKTLEKQAQHTQDAQSTQDVHEFSYDNPVAYGKK